MVDVFFHFGKFLFVLKNGSMYGAGSSGGLWYDPQRTIIDKQRHSTWMVLFCVNVICWLFINYKNATSCCRRCDSLVSHQNMVENFHLQMRPFSKYFGQERIFFTPSNRSFSRFFVGNVYFPRLNDPGTDIFEKLPSPYISKNKKV